MFEFSEASFIIIFLSSDADVAAFVETSLHCWEPRVDVFLIFNDFMYIYIHRWYDEKRKKGKASKK